MSSIPHGPHDDREGSARDSTPSVGELRWRSVIDSAVDAIVVIDRAGRIEAFNAAAERLFGYTEAELIGRNVSTLMPTPYREEHDGYLARYVETGHQKIIGKGREVRGCRRDGTTFPLHLSVGEFVVDGERKFTGILHDLSERVRMEERLREQAALATVGEMAAVIAHEVKNPLAGIRGAMQVLSKRLPAGSKDVAITHEIIARIDGLDALMKDLLVFARPPQLKLAPVDLHELLTSTANLANGNGAVAALDLVIIGTAPPVMADRGLLHVVFLNLMLNAAQAMGGKGTLRINLTADDRRCEIAFIDHGPGVSSDIRERIFTPFFTTKARGTGLGLPTAKRFVDAHGGSIEMHCPPNGGTVVTIQLPRGGPA